MTKDCLDARDLIRVIVAYQDALLTHREAINRLNVFPVPDGDTGTNMLATLRGVANELERSGFLGGSETGELSMGDVCQAIARGSLMGARGNSGVILCQILRGFVDVVSARESIGPREIPDGLTAGDVAARSAVLKPVEGTILTVAGGAAEGARATDLSVSSLLEVLESARKGALSALWSTPDLLPVLREAGVVDSGGVGLLLLLDAFLSITDGRALPSKLELPDEVLAQITGSSPLAARTGEEVLDGLAYEVMYLLDAKDDSIGHFKDRWSEIGDSIVVVGGSGLWNCHIHTNDIGAAIEAGIEVGRPREVRVTDLRDEVEEESWVRDASTGEHGLTRSGDVTSVVSVATGDGVSRIFSSLGVAKVIAGGQSMNPSVKEVLEVIDSLESTDVVVLPNNANIFPVAREAANLSRHDVFVVATEGVQEGFAALLSYDPKESGEENARQMLESAVRIVAGEVTQAVRSSSSSVGPITAGDYIGLSRTGIESVGSSLSSAAIDLLQALLSPEHEIVTLIEGVAVPVEEIKALETWLSTTRPEIAYERHYGGQALYPILLSIE